MIEVRNVIIFKIFLKTKNIQQYSRFTDKGPSIAECVIRVIRSLLNKPVFEKVNADWFSEPPSVLLNNIIKQFTNQLK